MHFPSAVMLRSIACFLSDVMIEKVRGGKTMSKLRLRELRMEKGLSQERIAEKLYVVRQTISNWERGLSYPSFEQMLSLSNLLEVPFDVLLGTDDDLVKARHSGLGLFESTQTTINDHSTITQKEEMIASIINRLNAMNETGAASLFDIIMLIPIRERWMAPTSQERIAELDAIAAQREKEEAQKKEMAEKEAQQKTDAKRAQIYHDYARMFNAIENVEIPTRYDLSLGEIQAIDFICGEISRCFPEYAYSVACKYFDYGFVKGMRYATARAKKKKTAQ